MNSMSGVRNFGGGSRGGGKGDIIPKGYRGGAIQQFTPEQLNLFSQLFSNLGSDSNLSRLAEGDESLFNEMEAPAMRQFSGLLGGLSNRFATGSGRGSTGALRSSGFQNEGTAAASNFAQELASNRQNLSRQALRDLFEMSHMLMGERPYERILANKRQKEPGFLQQFASNFAQSAGKSLGSNLKFGGGGGGGGEDTFKAGGISSQGNYPMMM